MESVVRLLRNHELPGIPVVNEGGRCVGIVTEADLVISGEEGDLHLPHYLEILGGVIFLEPIRHFEERLRKAFASKVSDMMTKDPVTIDPEATVRGRRAGDRRDRPQPPAGRGARTARRCRDPARRAGGDGALSSPS